MSDEAIHSGLSSSWRVRRIFLDCFRLDKAEALLRRRLVAALAMTMIFIAFPAHAEGKLPRFAALGSGEVNVRAGPGTRYPIRWVYHRRGMPVEITDEYGNWRKIRDVDGDEGWLHYSLLSGKRMALIAGGQQTLRRNPDTDAPAVLMAKPMAMGRLLRCNRSWCYLEVEDYKGWMEKTAFFGAYKEEKF